MDEELKYPDGPQFALSICLYVPVMSNELKQTDKPVTLFANISEAIKRGRTLVLLDQSFVSPSKDLIPLSTCSRISQDTSFNAVAIWVLTNVSVAIRVRGHYCNVANSALRVERGADTPEVLHTESETYLVIRIKLTDFERINMIQTQRILLTA